MFKNIISLIIIGLGLFIIFISLNHNNFKIYRSNKDEDKDAKYIYMQTISDIFSGMLFIILGLLSLFDILDGEKVGFISTVLVLINRISEMIISNKYAK
ncbi:hypothetical protein [Clostridium manihotivorum]|uniref:DUF3784 domain-containing protein n=1 Tax=Clostridium manihotivorum TaxID=2320868 RepID=A0A3R5QU34_9CLOT|nr:hypothetical protein [Clostridium manihotivorum]QAA32552.1 hypothetical protein C1I91_13420 [Clostridium manihotivorum]